MVSKRICPVVCAAAFVPMVYAKFKSGQGDEAVDSTDSTARRGNAVLV